MVCNVNKLNTISAIVRDNLGEQFMINYDIRKNIIKKVPPKLRIGRDSALAEFFMRINSRECRFFFMRHLLTLNIPLLTSDPLHSKIWVNGSNYKFNQNFSRNISTGLPTKSGLMIRLVQENICTHTP